MRTQKRVETNIYLRRGPQGDVYRVWMRIRGEVHDHTVDTLGEARAIRAKLLQKRAEPEPPADDRDLNQAKLTFSDWWDLWWPIRMMELEPATRLTYESLARRHVFPRFGDMALAEITTVAALAARVEMDTALSRSTTDKALVNVLSASLTAAVLDGHLLHNPVRAMPRRRGRRAANPTRENKHLSIQEVLTLAEAIGRWYSTMIRFQAETGLRIGELAALRVWDLDLAQGTARVEYSMSKLTGQLVPPKTQAGYRVVPLVRPAIAQLLRKQIAERDLGPNGFVFGGPAGGRLNQDTFRSRHFKRAVIKAGLSERKYRGKGVTPHWLRHTAITNMVSMGLTPMEVAAIAGHADSRVTESIYTHLNPASMVHARAAIETYWTTAETSREEGDSPTAA